MCQDKRFLISQEKKKIDSLQSQMNLHAQKKRKKEKKSWTVYVTVVLVFQKH